MYTFSAGTEIVTDNTVYSKDIGLLHANPLWSRCYEEGCKLSVIYVNKD
jgi:hypothetical protein